MHIKESLFNILAKTKKYVPLDAEIFSEYNKFRPLGAKKHFCYVPFSSMTLCVDGKVYACSYNRKALLGTVPEMTLKEIWFGKTAKTLRNHHLNNDLSFGCQHCKFFFDKRKFTDLKPHEFDQYATTSPHAFPRVLEFELSNICNLECQMCSGYNSSMIRKNRDKLPALKNKYDGLFLEELKEFIPYLKEAKFYGGEPFMIPLHYKIWDLMMEMNPAIEYFVITNGTHWNDRIEQVLRKGRFNIAVSIDSLDPDRLKKIRKNVDVDLLFSNINKLNAICKEKRAGFTLSFTMQQENRYDLPKMIEYCNELDAQIFISYLENPIKFAISQLSKEELENLLVDFKKYKFPKTTHNQKHNYNSFEEYKNYLTQMIKDSRFESYSELKEQEREYKTLEEKRFSEYQALKDFEIVPNAKNKIYEEFNEMFRNENFSKNDIAGFYHKVQKFESTLTTKELNKIYTMMLNGDSVESYHILNSMETEELTKRAKEAISNYDFTYKKKWLKMLFFRK